MLIQSVTESPDQEIVKTRGPIAPYIGSTTREKTTGKIYQTAESSRPLKSSQRIAQVSDWCIDRATRMYYFVRSIATIHTNLPMELLVMSTGAVQSGSVMHRLNDHTTKKSALYALRANAPTHCYISTDSMGKYGKGSDNVNLHFQGVLLAGLTLLHMRAMWLFIKRGDSIHLHYACASCEEYISEDKIGTNAKSPRLRPSPGNPLLYTHVEDYPNHMSPSSNMYKLSDNASQEEALAIIISRFLKGVRSTI